MKRLHFHALAITTISLTIIGLHALLGEPETPPPSETPQPGDHQVHILNATWGANCNTEIERLRNTPSAEGKPVSKLPEPIVADNVLRPLRARCDAKFSCSLRADAATFGFDPIEICHKQLVVSYRCFEFDRLNTLTIGQGEMLKINCREKAAPAVKKPGAPATTR